MFVETLSKLLSTMNILYYGDNLQILDNTSKTKPVDLTYLCLPFYYNLHYNETPGVLEP